jgi:hypothetical protein
VSLHVRVKADTYTNSTMKGQQVDFVVNETWLVSVDENTGVKIHEYEVVPLA